MDVIGPARLDETVEGALDQDVARMEAIEDAGIIDRNGGLEAMGVNEILGVFGRRFQGGPPCVELGL
ncbi:hypothetical protein [Paramesorhizobium deserti]|uniref:hypothetical protein n=1 Tax=Paramesorhizobium deserti TaxID=1494590 RepID=UPI0026998777